MKPAKGKKKERILRVLLNEPKGQLSKYAIAKKAQTSFPWVHEFLFELESEGYIKDTEVLDYSSIFELWKKGRGNIQRKDFVINNPLAVLSEARYKYALTTYQGENLVQGYLFPSRFDMYIESKDYEKWNNYLLQHGLLGSGNFRILIDDAHVFYKSKKIDEFTVVSTPQLIVDLYKEGGVCGEAADNLVRSMVHSSV